MPPKAKFTEQDIIEKAVDITREYGIDKVTARELGNRLHSSARPIFTLFTSMEEVKDRVIMYSKDLYKQYVTRGLEEELAFRGVGIAYITFAIKEPKLFQLLFMNEQKDNRDLKNTLVNIDENYETILESVRKAYDLDDAQAEKLYEHLWVYTHGISTLCATNVCILSPDRISSMLTDVFKGLLLVIKKEN